MIRPTIPFATGKCGRCYMHWKLEGDILRVHQVPAGPETRVFMRCAGSGTEPM